MLCLLENFADEAHGGAAHDMVEILPVSCSYVATYGVTLQLYDPASRRSKVEEVDANRGLFPYEQLESRLHGSQELLRLMDFQVLDAYQVFLVEELDVGLLFPENADALSVPGVNDMSTVDRVKLLGV